VANAGKGGNALKALTLWQPYAEGIKSGLKKYETRSWKTAHRGFLAIQASCRPLDAFGLALAAKYGLKEMSYGSVVAFAELLVCHLMTPAFIARQSQAEIDFGDWREGRYAWELGRIIVPEKPIPIKGKQGLWTLPADFPLPD
jgi:hypothetical protein